MVGQGSRFAACSNHAGVILLSVPGNKPGTSLSLKNSVLHHNEQRTVRLPRGCNDRVGAWREQPPTPPIVGGQHCIVADYC
jgi:hypothetical protein